ncbi:MAG TPA: putative glycoside hydrolase [Chloroflexota bacterium]|nr:putative glycoside hydrolase [Chloroflexota bacterium]
MTASEPRARIPSDHDDAGRSSVRLQPAPRQSGHSGGRRRARSSLGIGALVLGMLILTLAPLDLLLPKVAVNGVVRDRVTGAPIVGATVRLGPASLTTDSTGAFAVERASMTELIQVEASGYRARQARVFPPRAQQFDLVPRSFALNVRDAETNEPIADAVIDAAGIRSRPTEPGRFDVEPARDNMAMTVSAPGFQNTVVRYRGGGEVTVPMQPRVIGYVVDGSTGRAIPGASVTHDDSAQTTNEHGMFELDRRPSGPLRVLAPGYRRIEVDASQARTIVARVEPFPVKALYLTYFGVGDRNLRQNVLALVEKTEANAVVIDVKGDTGRLTYRSSVPLAEKIGANAEPTVPNIDELMAALKQRNIYTIARIVVFKDDVLARNGSRAGLDVSVRERFSNQPWTEGDGKAWVDPMVREVWEYNVELAREAAAKGFDEILFDGVRFPAETSGSLSAKQARYSRLWVTEQDRVETVGGFLREARNQIRLAGAFVSLDVQGYVAWNDGDNGVGHDLNVLASSVDYLCPTVHPSTFRSGLPGLITFPQVIQQPYAVVFESLRRARARTADHGTVFRPWLQYFDDFSWQTGRVYRTAEIDAQRNGAVAAGATGWMMWDPSNRYARGGLGSR